MSAEKLNKDEIQAFRKLAYELAGLGYPVNPDDQDKTIQKCIDELGKNFVNDVRAYSKINNRDTAFAQLFLEDVLTDIVNKSTLQIDEKKLKDKLKNYKKIMDKAKEDLKKLHGNITNLDYVALCNLGIKPPKGYKLTESDISYVFKFAAKTKTIPIKVKDNVYITGTAELNKNANPNAQTLFRLLDDFDKKNKGPYTAYVPLNLGNYHWIYLTVKKDDKGKITIDGFDSLNSIVDYTDLEEEIFNEARKTFKSLKLSDVNVTSTNEQKDSFSCGYQIIKGILKKVFPGNELCNKNSMEELQTSILSCIKEQAKIEGKLIGKKNGTQKNEIAVDEEMKEAIERISDTKHFVIEGAVDKWPIKAAYKPNDTTSYDVTINQIKNKSDSYISLTTDSEDSKAWKKLIDKVFEMGKTSVGIKIKDERLREELLDYCAEKKYAVKNSANKPANRK